MFASCVSPNICSSYHVVSSAVYRQWTPTSKHKANFSNISGSQKGFIQELQMCVYIESATQLLYWRLVLLHCRQAIHSLLNPLPGCGEYHHFLSCLYTPSPQRWIEFRSSGNTRMESWKFQYFPLPASPPPPSPACPDHRRMSRI